MNVLRPRREKLHKLLITLAFIFVPLVSLGYSALQTTLNIGIGNITTENLSTLYGVLQSAALEGTYAAQYNGDHMDSMAGEGNYSIYHWYGSTDTNATAVRDKNNVIFANHCWQMIRTTDTGGVKMIYFGEPVDGKCLTSRGTHPGYTSRTTQSLNTTYYYGTDYTYDKSLRKFNLSGVVTTGEIKTGEYTCKATAANSTCTTLYYVDTLDSGTTYYVLPINNNSNYSHFGELRFNPDVNSPAYVGYMYNAVYPYTSRTVTPTSYKYSKGFTWDGSKYVLDDNTAINNISDKNNLNNAHYTCFNTSGECEIIYYIYYIYSNTKPYYISISNGKSIEGAKNEMFYNDDVNTTDSVIKMAIDLWFEKYLLNYSDYLEDTIFCNDRSQLSPSTNGWNPNGGSIAEDLQFKEYNLTSDLSCTNETDRFSTLNNKAKLKYKVGLMSAPEMNLLGKSNARLSGQNYWLITPNYFSSSGGNTSIRYVYMTGNINGSVGSAVNGVRPAISLAPGTEYSSGTGTMADPYIVDTPSYTVTYASNDDSNCVGSGTVVIGNSAMNLCVPTREGYTFDGWYTNNGIKIEPTTSTIPADSINTVYAHWTPIEYTIAYSHRGGTAGVNHPTVGYYDQQLEVSNLTKEMTIYFTNSSGATIDYSVSGTAHSGDTKSYTFTGWTITEMTDSLHWYGTTQATETTSSGRMETTYRNLRNEPGTVTLEAMFDPVTFKLPKISKSGYVCRWVSYKNKFLGTNGVMYELTDASPVIRGSGVDYVTSLNGPNERSFDAECTPA